MTDPHTCPGYSCDRPECVRRQRDELRDAAIPPRDPTEDQRDAKRYRWIRQRLECRSVENMKGERRFGIDVRIGCAFFDSPIPYSTNPAFHDERSKSLDDAIDAALAEKEGK